MTTIRYNGHDLTIEPLNEDMFDFRILVGGCAILHSIEELFALLEGGQQ